ncbi:MAG: tRNA guanosine(34) transglycosylase Tgt [Candidatus Zixiibacteriota bacterium]|nr:MAG: tRNA guanosine(34) transglycosylase Tgt [candidate division Zixibacteria bacterium]
MTNDTIYHEKAKDGAARRGEVTTPHGTFQTPAFMPVGTSGTVKGLSFEDVVEIGGEIVLGNTYHLYLQPGHKLIESLGGLAVFTGWNGPTLTDSGGYQVFSLRNINRINDDGVEFQSHHDGSRHFFTPEIVTDIQHAIGADIIMAFDQCVPYPADHTQAAEGVRRTFEWAGRCLDRHTVLAGMRKDTPRMFGIVQGSVFKELRTQSAEQIVGLDFPGNAIGGLSVGEPPDVMEEMLAHTIEYLPSGNPRYLMGIGYPEDILMAVSYGVDMFDCILPTRSARTGLVFTSIGPLVFRNAPYAQDERPLDPNCDCRVCRRYSRAYLRHLYNQSEITGLALASYHSCFFYQQLMRNIRRSIEEERFESFRDSFLERYRGGDE